MLRDLEKLNRGYMEETPREDFKTLHDYYKEVYNNHLNKVVMRSERLIEIKNLIEHCDYIVESSSEKSIIVKTVYYWLVCLHFWSKYKPSTDQAVIEDLHLSEEKYSTPPCTALITVDNKKKTLDEILTKDDKNFLKRLERGDRLSDLNKTDDDGS